MRHAAFCWAFSAALPIAMVGAACSDKKGAEMPNLSGAPDAGVRDTGASTDVTGAGAGSDATAGARDVTSEAAPPSSMTVATKFCHEMVDLDTGAPIEFELVVGTTRFKTLGDGCATPSTQTCMPMPAGKVTARVFNGTVEAYRNELSLTAGRDYVFTFRMEEETGEGEILALPVPPALTCATAKLTDVPPPAPPWTTPVPAGGMADVKLCNGLTKPAVAPGLLEVTSEKGLRLSAAPGACAPAKSVPCSRLAAGEDTLTFTRDGKEIGSADVRYPAGGGLVIVPRTITGDDFLVERVVVPADETCGAYEPL